MSIHSLKHEQVRGLLSDLNDSVARLRASGVRFASTEKITTILQDQRPPDQMPPDVVLEFLLTTIGCERVARGDGQVWCLALVDRKSNR